MLASTPGDRPFDNLGGYFWELGFDKGKHEGSLWVASLGYLFWFYAQIPVQQHMNALNTKKLHLLGEGGGGGESFG